ncbi:MAG: PqiC family protein [Candidatus Omnitrophica bacterium]|jgi:hypothetical protein|nr:PqiC family protein [Candidatus Omnitrophota bacterium]
MRNSVFSVFILAASCFVFCGGCLSVPNSPAPEFYTLFPSDEFGKTNEIALSREIIVGIGPVEIPEYQNRPQIVTQDKNGMLNFAQFQRWGEPLDSGLARVILRNVSEILPQAEFQMFPCSFIIPLDYQVMVNILQLEIRLDGDVFMVVQWTIVDFKNKQVLFAKKSEFRQTAEPRGYPGIVRALSRESASLSEEIAQNIAIIANRNPKKNNAE